MLSQLNSTKFLYRFFSRRPARKITVLALFVLGVVLLAGWQFTSKVKEVVTEEFNQQQLVLARHAGDQISHHIRMLRKELTTLSLSPSVQYYERTFLAKRLQIAFTSMKEEGATGIRYIDASGLTTHVVDSRGYRTEQTDPDDEHYYRWARAERRRSIIHAGEVYQAGADRPDTRLMMKFAIPVWQTSVDDSHPAAAGKFSGVLIVPVDVTYLIQQLTKGIKSGRTGYAWVIDSSGTFLYHIENNLIGKNAFEARKEKKPTISFTRINEIQKKMMLTGKEGTSWYVTGWHRGKEATMKKLIAFSPIILDDLAETRIWSVAVVAPVSEVEGAIHEIQIRQFILLGVFIFVIIAGSFGIIFLMARWSSSLDAEVTRQTREFEKSEQKYRSLVENAEDIIFTVDQEGRFLSINNYGTRFLGRPQEEILGHRISDLFSWPTAEMLLTTIHEVYEIKRGRQVTHLVRIGDHDYWLNTSFRRLIDNNGAIYAILGISRNITTRKKMEEQSYYTEKLASMGTLAAGVAHEINNPLAVILGFTDLLIERATPGSEEFDMLKTIEGQGNKAKKVVDNLLTFARTKEHADVAVDINKNLTEVLTVLANNLLVKKISVVRTDMAEDLPPITADPDELQQVFLNIITNAVYAMKKGGTLSVGTRLSKDGSRVEIRISDTGPGISMEHRSKIFDPLFTTKKVGEGTGLGLSVSYGIIVRHRGTITFETRTKKESDQTGTTFIITLPVAQPHPVLK